MKIMQFFMSRDFLSFHLCEIEIFYMNHKEMYWRDHPYPLFAPWDKNGTNMEHLMPKYTEEIDSKLLKVKKSFFFIFVFTFGWQDRICSALPY